jgi:hypothetical protein
MAVLDLNGECLCLIYSYELVLGGVVVIVLATGLSVSGFTLGQERLIFKGDKSPYQDFVRRGNKAVGPIL